MKTPFIPDQDSVAIKVCRVLCIFFMSYVHVNPGHDFWPQEISAQLSVLGFVLAELLGRASVPALSVLSGYLAVSAYDRRPSWWSYAMDRLQIMFVPMIFWNALIILLSLIIFWLSDVPTAVMRHLGNVEQLTPLLIVDRLTGLNYGSAASALNFLRDLFFCSLLLPILRWCIERAGVVTVGLIWLMGMSIGFEPVVIRPHVLMFFAIGVYLVSHNDRLVPSIATVAKLFLALMLVFAVVHFVPVLQAYEDKNLRGSAFRLFMASLFLVLAVLLSRLRIGRLIARLEPMIYMMYLSHVVIFLILWGAWQQIFDKDLAWPYAAFFVVAPVVTVLIVQSAHKGLLTLPAVLQKVLVGKAST